MKNHHARHACRLFPALVLVLLGVVVPAAPARADAYQRDRNTALKFWTPSTGTIDVQRGLVAHMASIQWNFIWNQQWEMMDLQGQHRAIEFKALVSSNWSSDYANGQFESTNIPSMAIPYRDTSLDDSSGQFKPGYGAANANFLTFGVNYFAQVTASRSGGDTQYFPMEARAAASTYRSHEIYGSYCPYAPAVCVFEDYSHTVIRAREYGVIGDYSSPRNMTWAGNLVPNYSFESSGSAGYTFSPAGSISQTVWCTPYGRRSNCFLEFKHTSYGNAYVYRDIPGMAVPAGDNLTAEASLKCPGPGNCPAAIYYAGADGSYEERATFFTVPGDGIWYDCRVDFEHNGSSGLNYSHTVLRVGVLNATGSGYLSVDQISLSPTPVFRVHDTAGDAGWPAVGAACRKGDIW